MKAHARCSRWATTTSCSSSSRSKACTWPSTNRSRSQTIRCKVVALLRCRITLMLSKFNRLSRTNSRTTIQMETDKTSRAKDTQTIIHSCSTISSSKIKEVEQPLAMATALLHPCLVVAFKTMPKIICRHTTSQIASIITPIRLQIWTRTNWP